MDVGYLGELERAQDANLNSQSNWHPKYGTLLWRFFFRSQFSRAYTRTKRERLTGRSVVDVLRVDPSFGLEGIWLAPEFSLCVTAHGNT